MAEPTQVTPQADAPAPALAEAAAAPPAPVTPPEPVASPPQAPADVAPAATAAPAPDPAAGAPAAAEPAAPADGSAKPELTTDKPSLLETATKPGGEKPAEPAAAKPEEAKPAAEAKPADAAAAPPAEPAPLPAVEYKYELPETIKLDDATRGSFHEALDKFRADPAAGAQALIDMHAKAMQSFAEQTLADQHRAFNELRGEWNKQVLADPVIGGAGHRTAMTAVARMRDLLVPTEMLAPRKNDDGSPRISEFEEFLRVTGAGDHPVFMRLLHRAARFLDEPQAAEVPTNPKPPPGNGRMPGNRRAVMYDHPSSQKT